MFLCCEVFVYVVEVVVVDVCVVMYFFFGCIYYDVFLFILDVCVLYLYVWFLLVCKCCVVDIVGMVFVFFY